ncbi:agmatinase [Saccharicrinis fermentans]|uniref:Agmatinase n=1 Tax=Saccharicrinis fermentans DSM 9555 = JCM 21142 TaxID=869213 RepID=W7YCU7_9BACT|nr:agmatinase [Saccharicrinis fermentans]GAF02271.1 agmatinase [Saccharicrinis fermentans DSM 9555 = JCM 21142]
MDYTKYFCGEDGYCLDYNKAAVAVLPVPYDGTSTWVKGSDKGPAALIEASGTLEMFDIETGNDVSKKGIYTLPPVIEDRSPEKMSEAVERAITQLLGDGKLPVLVGGEHSVSIGAFKAMAKRYENITFLQFDAHADLRESYEGSAYNHACVMHQAKKLAPIVQVGIRSMCQEERVYVDPEKMFFRYQIRQNMDWQNDVMAQLSGDVYITIDLDVFDPSIMPSTGTPEPDGLLYHEVLSMIRKVQTHCNIVGFDVVELCPNEKNKAPDFLAAKLVYQVLSGI